jgi:hypothetical protein
LALERRRDGRPSYGRPTLEIGTRCHYEEVL